MGATAREDWEDVGSKLTGLGLKLKMHFEQAAKEGRPVDEDMVKENLHKVGDAVEQTFTALGAASRDDAVIQDVRDAGRSMLEALDSTFSELGDRFRSAVKPSDAPSTEAPATEETAAEYEPPAAPPAGDGSASDPSPDDAQ